MSKEKRDLGKNYGVLVNKYTVIWPEFDWWLNQDCESERQKIGTDKRQMKIVNVEMTRIQSVKIE